jgi:K+/H+ antiporter YhaU regulatory subunit KhtT
MFGMSAENVGLLGIAVQTVLFIIGGYALVIRNDENRKSLEKQISNIQEELKALGKIMTQMAVQTTRIDAISQRVNLLDQRVDDLRHGKGIVQ